MTEFHPSDAIVLTLTVDEANWLYNNIDSGASLEALAISEELGEVLFDYNEKSIDYTEAAIQRQRELVNKLKVQFDESSTAPV